MCAYQERFFVVFGGAGQYIRKIMKRETFNDLHVWDIQEKEWVDMREESPAKQRVMFQAKFDKNWSNNGAFRDIGPPIRRSQHVACIYGGVYIVHGGLYGENTQVLDDFACFDLGLGMWVRIK